MIICRVDAAAAGMVQAEAASLEERGGCGTFRGRDTQAWVTENGDGEEGVWGFKALELGGDVGLQRIGKWWTARTSKQTFSSLRSVCQSARTAGNLWRKRSPPWSPFPFHCVTLGRSLLSSTGRDWLSPLYSTRMKVESDDRIPGPGGTGGPDAREGV